MTITGDISSISNALLCIQQLRPKQGIFHLSLIYETEDSESVIVDKNTLKPIEDFSIDSDCFIIQKSLYKQFMAAVDTEFLKHSSNKKTEADYRHSVPAINKTEDKKERLKSIDISDNPTAKIIDLPVAGNPVKTKKRNHYDDSDLYIIEEHDFNCMADNRPTVFAIKYLSENYYTLYYRKSVYDTGNDTSFRKFLSTQPGELVAYRYCNSVSSIRTEFQNLGLSLRHNGKNELSKSQADQFLHSFHTLRFL